MYDNIIHTCIFNSDDTVEKIKKLLKITLGINSEN